MSQYEINKITTIVEPETTFNSIIESKEVTLDNYQSAKIVIKSGAGDEAITTAKIIAILQDETEQEIKTCEVKIGQNIETEINLVADELAHFDATNFKVKIEAISNSEITGTVIVVLSEPRFND